MAELSLYFLLSDITIPANNPHQGSTDSILVIQWEYEWNQKLNGFCPLCILLYNFSWHSCSSSKGRWQLSEPGRSLTQIHQAQKRLRQEREKLQLTKLGGTHCWCRTYMMVIWEDEHFLMTKGMFSWFVDSLRFPENKADTWGHIYEGTHICGGVCHHRYMVPHQHDWSMFGVGKSMVTIIVIEVCPAMEEVLYSSIVWQGPPRRVSMCTIYVFQH